MANGGTGAGGAAPPKQVGGPTGHTTVLQLLPVVYRISLIYLGDKRVQHGPGYRCRFSLNRGGAPDPANVSAGSLSPLDPITNDAVYPVTVPGASGGPPVTAVGDDKSALPLGQGGNNGDLIFDSTYRVSILDNHGGWGVDSTDGGPAKSRPGSYSEARPNLAGRGAPRIMRTPADVVPNSFAEDIFPDVPFRVIVRKFVGGSQESLSAPELANLRVLWEIKDPPEDLNIPADTGQRAFLRNWVQTGRTRPAEVGDDNCSADFAGFRSAPSGPLVTGSQVLFVAPYVAQPPVDRPVPPPAPPAPPPPGAPPPPNPLENVITHAQATGTPVPLLDAKRGQTTLTTANEPGASGPLDVGISDVIFRPFPAGGDNYRFLLSLTDAAGTDVRTLELDSTNNFRPAGSSPPPPAGGGGVTVANARAIQLRSGNDNIPLPFCYTTGTFVVWRRINIRLLAFTNSFEPPTTPPAAGAPPHPPANTIRNSIVWNDVKRQYREAFIELTGPQDTFLIDQANWQQMLQNYFRTARAVVLTPAQLAAGPYDNFLTAFFPTFLNIPTPGWTPQVAGTDAFEEWQWEHIGNLTTLAIQRACTALGIPAPRVNDRQAPDLVNNDGFYIFMTRRMIQTPPGRNVTLPPPPPGGTVRNIRNFVGGVYNFDRMFHMIDANTTKIFTHELGHGLWLRHGTTARIDQDTLAGNTPGAFAAPASAANSFAYQPSGGGNVFVSLYTMRETDGSGGSHPHPLEHDQNDIQTCLLSYNNDVTTNDFCALCLLALRFYDLPQIMARQVAQTTAGWDPPQIVRIQGTTLIEPTSPEASNPLIVTRGAAAIPVCTIGKLEPHTDNRGRRAARVLDTVAGAGYTLTPTGQGVTIATGNDNGKRSHVLVRATATATQQDYQLQFTLNGAQRAVRTIRVP